MKRSTRQFIAIRLTAASAFSFSIAPLALAQSDGGFTPVDQTVADLTPLSASLQSLRPDFGPPQGFSRVYTHPHYPNRFVRVEGAIVVEFPHSDYVETEDGVFPLIPEGAIFWIGGKSEFFRPAPEVASEPTQSPLFVNSRMDTRAATLAEAAALERTARQPIPPPNRPTVWSNEEYRRNRLERWLNVASELDQL